MLRWILRLTAIVVIATISSLMTAVWKDLSPPKRVPSALTDHLGGTWDQMEQAFLQRVTARFPAGSSEIDMATTLRREGFSRQDWGSSTEEEHEAVRREDDAVCSKAAYVYWHADAEHHLTAIRGLYRNEGCL